jgi:pyruvate formate lyase activating enzyme
MPAFFQSLPGKTLQCELCPHRCTLAEGRVGRCGVRENRDGALHLPYYGFITGLALDSIEKKPLYHYNPGSSILSVGFAGCNLHCPFCQNWHISQVHGPVTVTGRMLSPEELIRMALEVSPIQDGQYAAQIAYTYSEPLIHGEFLLDCMECAHRAGVANVLVTNGCVNPEAAEAILARTDAVNVDLKCFSLDTYSRVLGGDLPAVLEFIRMAWRKRETHLEITTLVIPDLNDSEEELDRCVAFIAGLSPEIPWHLSAYHPDYKWYAPPTDPERLFALVARARQKLRYVYPGNISGRWQPLP